MRYRTKHIALSLGTTGELPTEFRLFTAGWNDTENGRFLFDEVAAQSVMDASRQWGVDLAIDLEHQMLTGDSPADPTARDARGWCQLELRSDGSLWAVNVKWTPDGAQRLSEKRQRYISPAFTTDPETQRVTKMINVAITSIPATHDTPALVAASIPKHRKQVKRLASEKSKGMDPSLVSKALEAITNQDSKAALEILGQMIASAAGATPSNDDDAPDSSAPNAGAGGGDDSATAASMAPPDSSKTPPPPAKDDDASKKDKPEAVAASITRLMRITGKNSIVEAIEEVDTYRLSHLELERERQKLAVERATLEAAERRRGCVDLVKLAGRAPATVWADDKGTAPKKYLAAMPIEDFRDYVKDAIKSSTRGAPKQPTGQRLSSTVDVDASRYDDGAREFVTPSGTVTLTAKEIRNCEELKADLKVYAANKAILAAARRAAARKE